MNKNTLLKDKKYIEENVGSIPVKKMIALYEKYLHGSDLFLLGAPYDDVVNAIMRKHIPLKYCSIQTDNTKSHDIEYIRFRPHQWGAKEISQARKRICLGNTKDIYTLYTCNTKSGCNTGYCFEKAVYNYYGDTTWTQDNKRADKGGDITINGKEVQLKYAPKNGLATITNTDRILHKINELLKEVA
jgi:hypothetical protein